MMRIMFVCHGNICRSPMAEFVFKHLAQKAGLSENFTVRSSATSTEEIWGGVGNPIYPPAVDELRRRKIPFTDRRAVQLKKSDYENYDLFVVMDSRNIRGVNAIFGTDPDAKVKKLMDFAGGGEVADPWYSGDFDRAYNDIYKGCRALLEYLRGAM